MDYRGDVFDGLFERGVLFDVIEDIEDVDDVEGGINIFKSG